MAAACGVVGLAMVGLSFWRLDLRYALPTPIPSAYTVVGPGDVVALPSELASRELRSGRPTLLHFYNPECPCSRFNLDHVRELATRHADTARFVAVLECEPDEAPDVLESLRAHFDQAVFDPDGRIAAAVGVYSTPQAAIVTSDNKLFWRGNYNTSRYCANRESEFARLALERACAGESAPHPDERAQKAWGCPLPNDAEATL